MYLPETLSFFKLFLLKTQNREGLNKPVYFTHTLFSSSVNETIYLLGNLSVFKIHVNRFMAWDDSAHANVISKCMLWVRGQVTV